MGQRGHREEVLTVGMTFVNGLGGVRMMCRHCGADLERELSTGNYHCPTPGCGKGSLTSPAGITTTTDEDGNVRLESGRKPS